MLHRFDAFTDGEWAPRSVGGPRRFMATDVYKKGDRYFLEVDVPGVEAGAVDVTVEKRTLTVTVERTRELDEERSFLVQGRSFGSFTRRFYLSDGVDSESIEASLENGVLTLAIPIVETAKARKIEIGTIRPAVAG